MEEALMLFYLALQDYMGEEHIGHRNQPDHII
jgi:hypothetical protein